MRLPVADSRTIRRRLLAILRRRCADFAFVFALQLTVALMGVVAPVLIGRTIDAVSQGAGPGPVRAGILVLCAVVVVQTAVGYMGEYRANCLAERVLTELRDRVVWAVTHMPLGTVEAAGTGDMLGRTTYDVEKVQGLLQQGANRILVLAMTIVTTIGAALLTDLRLGAFAVVPVIPLFYAIRWYLRRAIPAYLAVSAVRARMSGVVSETVEQNATADAQSLRPVRVARVDTLIREMWRNERYTGWVRGLFALGMQIIVSLPVLLVVLVGAGMIADGRTTLGTVTAVALYALQLRNPLWIIGWWVDEIQFAAASFARIFGVEQALGDGAPSAGPADDGTPRDGQRDEASAAERENPEISADRQSPNAGRTPDAEPADRTPQGPWTDRTPCGGDLAIADVRFSYRDGEEVLHGVSLDVREGERLAIVGPSGAGKSTLGRLVAGINPPSHGSIAVGGAEVTRIPEEALHSTVAMVTQEHHVFVGTLADNLRLAKEDAGQEEMLAALAAVEAAWVHDLDEGLDTRVGSGGKTLTPAQAQQIALARIVLLDPGMLVLDEATSLMDSNAARSLERALSRVLEGRTVISIAHRLYTAHDADRVAVMIDGRLAELGTHDELVAREGEYARLWHTWQQD